MSVPRGFALVLEDARRAGWSWVGISYRGTVTENKIIDHKMTPTQRACAHTVVTFWRERRWVGDRLAMTMHWVDGRWASGWVRHPEDPVPVSIGSRDVRPLLSLDQEWPRWVRPDLGKDEGTAPAHRWAPDIEQRVQAGMDERRAYARSLREGS